MDSSAQECASSPGCSFVSQRGVRRCCYAIYGLHGEWEVEGHGIPPDVEVQELPKDVAAGHDAQLERAVSIVLQQLKEHPIVLPVVPPYPNYHQHDGLGVP